MRSDTPTPPVTIPDAARLAAERFGDSPAVIEKQRTLSFNALWGKAKLAASALIERGVGKGERVALWAPNRSEWIIAALGAQIAGAAIVPLNTRLKGREAGDILRRARCSALFTVQEFLGVNYPALLEGESLPDLRAIIRLDREWESFLASGRNDDPRVERALAALAPGDVSDIMFTSGTTGAPKGVISEHGQVIPMFRAWAEVTGLADGDRYLCINPFFHTFGYKAGWVACLLTGAAILPMAVFDAAEAVARIESDDVSFLPGPPTIYEALLAELDGCRFSRSRLRVAVTGAAVVPPALVQRMRSQLGFATVVTGYGMTECGTITMCRAGDPIDLVARSCGRAMPGLEVKCVADDGLDCASGQIGEIVVRGYGVMRGYLDDPIATAEAIDTGAWLHTGDVGVLDADGYLTITDRKKDMFISGGFNCYPAEIEKLLGEHPAIAAAAVKGAPDQRLGEVCRAWVVLRPGADASPDEIIGWARANMANYKAPRAVTVVAELPRNAGGKVVKSELV